MNRSYKISFLKEIIKAVSQAAANINCEPEFNIDKKTQKEYVKRMLNDDKLIQNIKEINNNGKR